MRLPWLDKIVVMRKNCYFYPTDHPAKPMAKDNKNYEQDATNHSIIVLDALSPCCGQRGRRRQNPS